MVLSLASGAKEVENRLLAIAGIESVASGGSDPTNPGFELFKLQCEKGRRLVPQVLELARSADWTVGSASLERRTLETVFHELERAHIAQVSDPSQLPGAEAG